MVGTIPGLTVRRCHHSLFPPCWFWPYSAFCLTSLDTATRLGSLICSRNSGDGSMGETEDNVTGYKKVHDQQVRLPPSSPLFLGIFLGLNGYEKIWGLFGAANQLLAALGLLAVAAWLGNVGKNNKMFLLPMAFMLVVTITSLVITIKSQFGLIAAGGADWGAYVKAILGRAAGRPGHHPDH